MDSKSMFSVNTFHASLHAVDQHGSQTITHQNQLHDYFQHLLPVFSQEYSYLSRIFFLQLVLRQNLLLYTEDRVDVRDIWLAIARKLQLPKPDIYVVDENIKIQEVLGTKNQYQRVMLYDVEKLPVESVNKILNMGLQSSNVSFIAIQNPKNPIKPYVSDLFSMTFVYHSDQQITQLMETMSLNKQLEDQQGFQKIKFNQCVRHNFQIALNQIEEQGFLKPFITLFEELLKQKGIQVPQSRWKKMLKVIKFIGLNKHVGNFKRASLSDFVMLPQLLASNYEQHTQITQVMRQSMKLFIPYYGTHKFDRSIKSHFFIAPTNIAYMRKLCNQLQNRISFFYPCSKFPQTASVNLIKNKQQDMKMALCYRIRGFQKKIKSDHHFQIKNDRVYKLRMKVRSDCNMIVHLGVTCYDGNKNYIDPIQVCRRKNSEVIYERVQGEYLYVSNAENLKNWENLSDGYAYERVIGVYSNGDTSCLQPITNLIFNKQDPYSRQNRPYLKIEGNKIHLSQMARQWFVNFRHTLEKGKSVIMNHFQAGGECIGQTVELEKEVERNIEIWYKGVEFENSGSNFFPQTKYVRVVGLINYNSGHPQYKIQEKDGNFFVSDVYWQEQ